MYVTIAEFVEDWGRETAISLKVERALTDASLSQRSDSEGNTLGRLAWHMVVMIGGHGAALGLEVVTSAMRRYSGWKSWPHRAALSHQAPPLPSRMPTRPRRAAWASRHRRS